MGRMHEKVARCPVRNRAPRGIPIRWARGSALLALALSIAGCGDPSGERCEDGACGGGTSCGDDCPAFCGDGVCTTPEESAQSCPADCPACAPIEDVTALIESGELFFGYSMLGTASVTPGCGSFVDAKEIAVRLAPEREGTLVLSTLHPSTRLDTVLEVRAGSCEGAALGCNAEATAQAPGSRLSLPVEAGATYVALIETADDEAGVFALGLYWAGVCEDEGVSEDITTALLTGERFVADTAASTSSVQGSCSSGAARPEVRYRFDAPRTGVLVATTAHPSTSFDPVLHVRQASLDGVSYCGSPEAEIGCATSGAPGGAGPLLRFDVLAGRGYDLFVDGAGAEASGQGEAVLALGYAATSPVRASLEGCNHHALQDQFAFFATSGQQVFVAVDTVDAETAADTRLRVRLPDGTELHVADDEADCSFPPPSYRCPAYGFSAAASGLYSVEVYVGSTESCFDRSRVNYELTVTLDDAPSELIHVRDD